MSLRWLPLLLLAGLVAAGFMVDRLLLWMERRGWILYRGLRPEPRGLGPAFLEVQRILEPGARHVLEEKVRRREQDDDEGGPDAAGNQRRGTGRRVAGGRRP